MNFEVRSVYKGLCLEWVSRKGLGGVKKRLGRVFERVKRILKGGSKERKDRTNFLKNIRKMQGQNQLSKEISEEGSHGNPSI